MKKAVLQVSDAAVSDMDRDPDVQPKLTAAQKSAVEEFAIMIHGAEKAAGQVNGIPVNPTKRGPWGQLPEILRRVYRDMAGALLVSADKLEEIGEKFHAEPPPPTEPDAEE